MMEYQSYHRCHNRNETSVFKFPILLLACIGVLGEWIILCAKLEDKVGICLSSLWFMSLTTPLLWAPVVFSVKWVKMYIMTSHWDLNEHKHKCLCKYQTSLSPKAIDICDIILNIIKPFNILIIMYLHEFIFKIFT